MSRKRSEHSRLLWRRHHTQLWLCEQASSGSSLRSGTSSSTSGPLDHVWLLAGSWWLVVGDSGVVQSSGFETLFTVAHALNKRTLKPGKGEFGSPCHNHQPRESPDWHTAHLGHRRRCTCWRDMGRTAEDRDREIENNGTMPHSVLRTIDMLAIDMWYECGWTWQSDTGLKRRIDCV